MKKNPFVFILSVKVKCARKADKGLLGGEGARDWGREDSAAFCEMSTPCSGAAASSFPSGWAEISSNGCQVAHTRSSGLHMPPAAGELQFQEPTTRKRRTTHPAKN